MSRDRCRAPKKITNFFQPRDATPQAGSVPPDPQPRSQIQQQPAVQKRRSGPPAASFFGGQKRPRAAHPVPLSQGGTAPPGAQQAAEQAGSIVDLLSADSDAAAASDAVPPGDTATSQPPAQSPQPACSPTEPCGGREAQQKKVLGDAGSHANNGGTLATAGSGEVDGKCRTSSVQGMRTSEERNRGLCAIAHRLQAIAPLLRGSFCGTARATRLLLHAGWSLLSKVAEHICFSCLNAIDTPPIGILRDV